METVKYAMNSKFHFGTIANDQLFPDKYWDFETVSLPAYGGSKRVYIGLKKNLSLEQQQEAFSELRDSEAYRIACHQACDAVVSAGAVFAGVAGARIKETSGLSEGDWVPGDWGYLSNTGVRDKNRGTTGENIVYMGNGKWWGHYLSIGSPDAQGNTITDLNMLNKNRVIPLKGNAPSWENEVDMFDGVQDNSFLLNDYRKYTSAGLK
jgi:hypothetical protein